MVRPFVLLFVAAGWAALTSCTTLGVSRVQDPMFSASVSSPGGTKGLVVFDGNGLVGSPVQMDVATLKTIHFIQPSSDESEFVMAGGGLFAQGTDLFHVAGVPFTVKLTDVKLALTTPSLLRVEGLGPLGGWCDFTAENQVLAGNVQVDRASALRLTLTQGSSFSGTINQGAPGGLVEVSIDATSEWTLTADSHVTLLTGPLDRINPNGHRLWVGNQAVL